MSIECGREGGWSWGSGPEGDRALVLKPEAATAPPLGAHGAAVNRGFWLGPEHVTRCCIVLHPLDNAALLHKAGYRGHGILWSVL